MHPVQGREATAPRPAHDERPITAELVREVLRAAGGVLGGAVGQVRERVPVLSDVVRGADEVVQGEPAVGAGAGGTPRPLLQGCPHKFV